STVRTERSGAIQDPFLRRLLRTGPGSVAHTFPFSTTSERSDPRDSSPEEQPSIGRQLSGATSGLMPEELGEYREEGRVRLEWRKVASWTLATGAFALLLGGCS